MRRHRLGAYRPEFALRRARGPRAGWMQPEKGILATYQPQPHDIIGVIVAALDAQRIAVFHDLAEFRLAQQPGKVPLRDFEVHQRFLIAPKSARRNEQIDKPLRREPVSGVALVKLINRNSHLNNPWAAQGIARLVERIADYKGTGVKSVAD